VSVLILGAGGHAKVVADVLELSGTDIAGYLDDDPRLIGERLLGYPVLGPIASLAAHAPTGLIVGVGSNDARRRIVERVGDSARELWINAIHPRAVVAASARRALGQGILIGAGAVVNPDTRVADHVIVNTGATVDHDCDLGVFAHIAPGCHLAGNVTVGAGTLIGIGSTVIPGIHIGARSIVGAGSVVVRDVPDGVTAKGVPARWGD
jgi:sugar O-acyltransferase (sialic acid O-acetyltransferase NeuD family)